MHVTIRPFGFSTGANFILNGVFAIYLQVSVLNLVFLFLTFNYYFFKIQTEHSAMTIINFEHSLFKHFCRLLGSISPDKCDFSLHRECILKMRRSGGHR